MSSPESPSPSRPAKAAGFALLGVAAVALVIGIVSLFDSGSAEPPAAGGTSTTATSAPASSETSSPAPESSSAPAAATTTTAPPTTTTTQPPVQTSKGPVRVYNNSTITGLAARAAEDVKRGGWEVAETGNYSQGLIPTTTVYYQPGTNEEASARELATALKARVEPRFDGIETAAAGVILIVTNDYKGSSGKY